MPPDAAEAPAPFRAPGLPVEVPRREAALVRIARAGWLPAREVAREGAQSMRALPSLRETFLRCALRVREGLREWLLFHVFLPVYAVGFFFIAGTARSAPDPTRKILTLIVGMTVLLGVALVLIIALVMLLEGIEGAVRVLLRRAFLGAATAGIATGVFVGAAVRELGREVARKAYDVRVRRARTRVRVAVEASGDEGGASDEKIQPRAKDARRLGGA